MLSDSALNMLTVALKKATTIKNAAAPSARLSNAPLLFLTIHTPYKRPDRPDDGTDAMGYIVTRLMLQRTKFAGLIFNPCMRFHLYVCKQIIKCTSHARFRG